MAWTIGEAGTVCATPTLSTAFASRALNATREDLRLALALVAPLPLPPPAPAPAAAPEAAPCVAVVRAVQLCLGFWFPTLVLAALEGAAREAYSQLRSGAQHSVAGQDSDNVPGSHDSRPQPGDLEQTVSCDGLPQLLRWQGSYTVFAFLPLIALSCQLVMAL